MTKLLLKHGANVNATDENGNTALHLARSSAIVETLLNAGANVNATNRFTETALSVICEERQNEERYLGKPLVEGAIEKRHADANVIEMLLKFGADPNMYSPLYFACKNNDSDAVRLLLTYGADANLVKESVFFSSRPCIIPGLYQIPSPLYIACKNGNPTMVDCLLANGANVTFRDLDENSLLHVAVNRQKERSEECDPIVALLLQHNAAVNAVSNSGESPLYAACTRGLTGVVKQLLDCNADVGLYGPRPQLSMLDARPKSKKIPLMVACEKKFSDIAIMLLDRGADANVRQDAKVYQDEQTPLKLASANGDAVLVKHLLASGAVDDTALHASVVANGPLHHYNETFNEIIQTLLKSGANANAFNRRGQTPLHLACTFNDDIVTTLLVHGADPNTRDECHGPPPLSIAAGNRNSKLMALLIKFGARLDETDSFGRTALHRSIGFEEDGFTWVPTSLQRFATDTSAAYILLSAGADANVIDNNGATPLYLTCAKGMTKFVKLLLSHGASPNTGRIGKYPLLAACKGQHYDLVKLLLLYNADVTLCDENGKTCLHHALLPTWHKDNRSELVQLLLDKGADTQIASKDGVTPFCLACSIGLVSAVAKMLEYGAKANCDIGKTSPLVVACRNNHMSVVQVLLFNGADPNVLEEGNVDLLTLPLYIAATDKNIKLVELLLKHGANIDFSDINGNTALHHVIKHCRRRKLASSNEESVLHILLENKADVNIANSSGETPLYRAASRELPDIVNKMLIKYGGNPNKGWPLVASCKVQNVKLVEMLLNHGANPNMASTTCDPNSKQQKLPLFVALKEGNRHIISLLLNAGASVTMVNHEGQNVMCFVVELLTKVTSDEKMTEVISTIHLLLQHGANFNMLMPDGHSPLYLAVATLRTAQARGYRKSLALVVQLLRLMVKHGAMLLDSVCLTDFDISRMQSINCGTLVFLTTFDNKCYQKLIVDLLRAGAGFQVIAACCNAIDGGWKVKSIRLCQAVVLAGYSTSDEELQNLQEETSDDETEEEEHFLLQQLLNWLNEDRRQAPSLLRQCRVAIRRQLSEAVHHRTIIPAIDKLPLPNDVKLYLQFAGTRTEVDLSINGDK